MIRRSSVVMALCVLFSSGALAHADSNTVCATAGQQPEVAAARADLQDTPDVLAKRLHLADLLLNAGCPDEALHVLEVGEASNPRNSDLQYRLIRARGMLRERQYFESIDQAAQAQRHVYAPVPTLPGPDRQSAAAEAQASQTQPRLGARPVADTTGERVIALPPPRTSFSNLEPASRSN